jgi:hypothetical protein
MMPDAQQSRPAYLPFATFRAAIQNLRAHGLPPKLDKSAWTSRSYTEQAQIWAAFQFLQLVDNDGRIEPPLQILVEAKEDTPEEKAAIAVLLKHSYEKVFALDLKTATPKQLEDAMAEYGVSGSTRQRAIRFFIKAAQHVGTDLSPRLTVKLRDRSSVTDESNGGESEGETQRQGTRLRRRRRNNPAAPTPFAPPLEVTTQPGTSKTVRLESGGTLVLSATLDLFSLNPRDRKFLFELIDQLEAYEREAANGRTEAAV